MLERSGLFIRCLLFAPEYHRHVSLGIELDDHVRSLVDRPDIVGAVDADDVGERPCVQVLADLANEFAVRAELEKLRGGGRVRGTERVAPRKATPNLMMTSPGKLLACPKCGIAAAQCRQASREAR